MGQGFTNYWLLNNYSRINIELTKRDQTLIIKEGNHLFYIFILKNILEFKFQNWFEQILDSNEVSMNFRGLKLI